MAGAAAWLLGVGRVQAQPGWEPAHILQTGGAGALVTATEEIDPSGQVEPRIRFAIGFATAEQPAPGALLDSFTFSLRGAAGSGPSVYYLTADGSGLQLAPSTPGNLALDPQSISLTPIPFPEGLTGLPNGQAWEVLAPVPEGLRNGPLVVHLDLFDNGDLQASLGWASQVGVVPEPTSGVLLLVGLAAGGAMLRTRRDRRGRSAGG